MQQINEDGNLGIKVNVPCPQVTCACFGGENLDTLYISTAQEDFTNDMHEKFPLSGSIFQYKFESHLNIQGVNSRLFNDDKLISNC